MTPPEKPDNAEAGPDRASVATDHTPGQPADTPAAGGDAAAEGAPAAQANDHTPPPWSRVSADPAPEAPPGEATQTLPRPPAGGFTPSAAYRPDDEVTVNVPRPVVTGTAAGRLFGTAAPQTEEERTGTPAGGTPLGGAAGGAPPSALRRPGRGPRRANLQVKRFDPWSVLKLSLVLGVALFFVWLVAVGALYAVLDGMGVWDKINGLSSELLNASESGGGGDQLISAGRVFGIAAIIGAINIVLFSALATVGAFVYNVSADLAGGLEVTLAERE
ncbi:hypothetical protein BJP25_00040 [Actinokineospora bangkokensis]|uniref:DUF3566 domain-containing protein n=1 Tax=Actinokineospora bangkokensis TaxID=1193682 RepID=A0A1Q9LUB3_9PSEU|nr:hypothetical protein BJP25_00040 [Actinokineospora bangkokensis]